MCMHICADTPIKEAETIKAYPVKLPIKSHKIQSNLQSKFRGHGKILLSQSSFFSCHIDQMFKYEQLIAYNLCLNRVSGYKIEIGSTINSSLAVNTLYIIIYQLGAMQLLSTRGQASPVKECRRLEIDSCLTLGNNLTLLLSEAVLFVSGVCVCVCVLTRTGVWRIGWVRLSCEST